jgi:hypothetical protein
MRLVKTLITATHQFYDNQFIVKKLYHVEITSLFEGKATSDSTKFRSEFLKIIDVPDNFNRSLAISGQRNFYLLQFEDEFKKVLDPTNFLIDEIKVALKYSREKSFRHNDRFSAYRFKTPITEGIAKIYSVISVLDQYIDVTSSYSIVLTALLQADLSIGIDIASVEELFFVVHHFRKYGMLIVENTDFGCLAS